MSGENSYTENHTDEELSVCCREVYFKYLDDCSNNEIDELILILDEQKKEIIKNKIN